MTYILLTVKCNEILQEIKHTTMSAHPPGPKQWTHQKSIFVGWVRYIMTWPIWTTRIRIPRVIVYMRSWWRVIWVLFNRISKPCLIRKLEFSPLDLRFLWRKHRGKREGYHNVNNAPDDVIYRHLNLSGVMSKQRENEGRRQTFSDILSKATSRSVFPAIMIAVTKCIVVNTSLCW